MSTVTTLHGQTTFAFNYAIKRARIYLQKTNQGHQIHYLPDTYPQHPSELSHIDIVPKAKILKAHLEDTFDTDRFSVHITRRKSSHTIKVIHDSLETEQITKIAQLYADSDTCVFLEKLQE